MPFLMRKVSGAENWYLFCVISLKPVVSRSSASECRINAEEIHIKYFFCYKVLAIYFKGRVRGEQGIFLLVYSSDYGSWSWARPKGGV